MRRSDLLDRDSVLHLGNEFRFLASKAKNEGRGIKLWNKRKNQDDRMLCHAIRRAISRCYFPSEIQDSGTAPVFDLVPNSRGFWLALGWTLCIFWPRVRHANGQYIQIGIEGIVDPWTTAKNQSSHGPAGGVGTCHHRSQHVASDTMMGLLAQFISRIYIPDGL